MTTLLWKRRLRVTVAGLIIESGKIAIDIKRENTQTSLTGHVDLYNLNEAHTNRIRERESPVTVEGGYGDGISTLAVGRTLRVEKRRDGLERIARIHLDPLTRSIPGVTNRAYNREVTLRRVVRDLVTDFDEGIELGSLDPIPERYVDRWAFDGSTTSALSDLLDPHSVSWYCDNDRIRFNRVGFTQPGETLIVNRNTGLVSSPSETDDGATLSTLLEPRARIGGLISLTSDVLVGTFKVVKLQHVGDNYDGDLVTNYDVRVHEET